MKQKTYLLTVGIVFTIVAIAHLVRLIFGWEVLIDTWALPVWFSAVFIFIGYLAFEAFRHHKVA